MTLMPVSRMPLRRQSRRAAAGGASRLRNSLAASGGPPSSGCAEDVEQAAEALDGHRHPQRRAAVVHRRAAPQARRAVQGDGAHLVRVEMVEHFQHRAPAVDRHLERPVQRRQRLAGNVHHRPVHFDDVADRLARGWRWDTWARSGWSVHTYSLPRGSQSVLFSTRDAMDAVSVANDRFIA